MYFGVGEFAKRAGVSVRTLQYYDQIGVLRPTTYSESGRRLYCEDDFFKLQQIITLKFIGLSLDQIREIISSNEPDAPDILSRQKYALKKKIRQLKRIVRVIEMAEASMQSSLDARLERFINIIQEINMSDQTNWISDFFTEAQQTTVRQMTEGKSLSDHKREGEAWKQLFLDIQEYSGGEANEKTKRELTERWQRMLQNDAHNDEALQASLQAAYEQITTVVDVESLPLEMRSWLQSIQDAAAFMEDEG